MSIIIPIIFFVITAFIFTGIASLFFKTRGPWGTLWSFFLIVFLFLWASSLWVHPIGPVFYDVSWGSVLFVGLLITLFLIAVSPRSESPTQETREDDIRKARGSIIVLDFIFWIVTLILMVSIIASYFT